jgi:hypothetical protein
MVHVLLLHAQELRTDGVEGITTKLVVAEHVPAFRVTSFFDANSRAVRRRGDGVVCERFGSGDRARETRSR